MGRPIEITRFDLTAAELRELAARTQDGAVVRRLLAIAPVLVRIPTIADSDSDRSRTLIPIEGGQRFR